MYIKRSRLKNLLLFIYNSIIRLGQYRQSIIDIYEANGKTLDPTGADREIIARFTSEMLFNEKGNTLERFINEVNSEDRNAISQFIHDFISWLKARLKGEKVSLKIVKLENRFAAVLRSVDNTNAQKNNTTNDGDVQYLFEIDAAVDEIIQNHGNLKDNYNQRKISKVPKIISQMVNVASGGTIDISQKTFALNGSDTYHEYVRHTDNAVEQSRNQIAFTDETFKDALKAFYSPDIVECVFSTSDNPTQRQSFAYAKKQDGYYVVVEAVGGKRNPNVVPVEILYFTEHKWNEMIIQGKTIGEILFENNPEYYNSLDIEANKKNRVTAAQFASNKEAIANTLRSPLSNPTVSQDTPEVNTHYMQESENYSSPEQDNDGNSYSFGDIDVYDEAQYNDYGWVTVNGILTGKELKQLYSQFADIKLLKHKCPKTPKGEYIIFTGHNYGMIDSVVFIKGTNKHPIITKIYTYKSLDKTNREISANEVSEYEQRGYDNANEIIEAYAGHSVFSRYTLRDCLSYWEQKRQGFGTASNKNSGKRNFGTGSAQQNKATDKAGLDNSAFSMPENDDEVSYSFEDDIVDKTSSLAERVRLGEISQTEYLNELQSLMNEATEKYGAIPKSENPKVDVTVPKQVSDKRNTRRFVRTVLESGTLTDEMVADTKKALTIQVNALKFTI